MILERIQNLCNERNTNIAQLEKELGFGKSTIRRWNTSSPSVDNLQKVADYFKVSVDSLLKKD